LRKIHIAVTQQHIDQGIQNVTVENKSPNVSCAVALALQEKLGPHDIRCGAGYVATPPGEYPGSILLPKEARTFIDAFDLRSASKHSPSVRGQLEKSFQRTYGKTIDEVIKPFEFDLEVPDEWVA
jgi:hypothetical protein